MVEVKQEQSLTVTTGDIDHVGETSDVGDISDTNTEIYDVSPKEEVDEDTEGQHQKGINYNQIVLCHVNYAE